MGDLLLDDFLHRVVRIDDETTVLYHLVNGENIIDRDYLMQFLP